MLDSLVKKGMTVIDVGASTGEFSARFSRLVGRSGRVHVVEPQPINQETLRGLARRRANVTVHFVAASDQAGVATLSVPSIGGTPRSGLGTLRLLDTPSAHIDVPVVRLDELIDGEVHLIKCDVEGNEVKTLAGASAILEKYHPLLSVEIEQRHLGDVPITEAIESIESYGYIGSIVTSTGLLPLANFDVRRDQLDWVSGSQHLMPAGYLNTFVFMPR